MPLVPPKANSAMFDEAAAEQLVISTLEALSAPLHVLGDFKTTKFSQEARDHLSIDVGSPAYEVSSAVRNHLKGSQLAERFPEMAEDKIPEGYTEPMYGSRYDFPNRNEAHHGTHICNTPSILNDKCVAPGGSLPVGVYISAPKDKLFRHARGGSSLYYAPVQHVAEGFCVVAVLTVNAPDGFGQIDGGPKQAESESGNARAKGQFYLCGVDARAPLLSFMFFVFRLRAISDRSYKILGLPILKSISLNDDDSSRPKSFSVPSAFGTAKSIQSTLFDLDGRYNEYASVSRTTEIGRWNVLAEEGEIPPTAPFPLEFHESGSCILAGVSRRQFTMPIPRQDSLVRIH